MNPVMPTPVNSWDQLCDIFAGIMQDGGQLLGMTYGQFQLLITAILEPAAIVLLAVAAALALNRRKSYRYAAVTLLCAGVVLAMTALGLFAYAAITGQSWAFADYGI